MRAFSIFFVVFGHVLTQSVGLNNDDSAVNEVIWTFRLPMFFMVSGYFAYKIPQKWTWGYLKDIYTRKFFAQEVGPLIFCTLLLFCSHSATPWGAFHGDVQGYWFTFALFKFFIIYTILSLMGRVLGPWVVTLGLIAVSVMGIVLAVGPVVHPRLEPYIGHSIFYNYQFFAMGILFRKYQEPVNAWLGKNWVKAFFILAYIVGCIATFVYFTGQESLGNRYLREEVVRLLGMVVVYTLFFGARERFKRDTPCMRAVLFTGRRTLDIYVIHYFFLPTMPFVKPWLLGMSNSVIFQAVIGCTVALIVVALSLGTSQLLRTSPLLARLLFGAKEWRVKKAKVVNVGG